MQTNTQIESQVRAALRGDPRVKHPELIAVSVDEIGTGVLHGAVADLLQWSAAVHDTRQTEGVSEVIADDLKVHPPIADRRSDDELRAQAMQRVIDDARIRSNQIHLTVSRGWVTLAGSVGHQAEHEAAVEDIVNLPGVTGVNDELEVR